MRTRIAVLKKDLIDVLLLLEKNNNLSSVDIATSLHKFENRRKAIKKLQHLADISDMELKDLYWKKQYSGE